jgi:hypothetical protein
MKLRDLDSQSMRDSYGVHRLYHLFLLTEINPDYLIIRMTYSLINPDYMIIRMAYSLVNPDYMIIGRRIPSLVRII